MLASQARDKRWGKDGEKSNQHNPSHGSATLTGLYVCWVRFTAPGHVGGAKYIFVLGPFMVIVGAVWLASDWFDL